MTIALLICAFIAGGACGFYGSMAVHRYMTRYERITTWVMQGVHFRTAELILRSEVSSLAATALAALSIALSLATLA